MRTLALVACLAMLVIGSSNAQASDDSNKTGRADEAEVQFRLGNDALDARRFNQALSHFFASHRLAPNRNVLVNIALCYQGLKAHVEAYRYFSEAIHEGMTQQERKAIERARQQAKRHIAVLDITSDPPGAEIYLGREDLGIQGTTPRTLAVPPSSGAEPLVVIVKSKYYKAHRQELRTLRAGDQRRLHVTLESLIGELNLEGRPADFEVEIDGKKRGKAKNGQLKIKVAAGTRNIRFLASGHVPSPVRQIDVEPATPQTLSVALEFASGAIVVNTDEPDSRVFLDDELVGFAPTVIERVSAGTHQLAVCKQGFICDRQKVTLEPNQRLQVEAKLDIEDTVQGVSGVRESVLSAPASVSLLTAREIQAFGYTTVADALVGTRGMYNTYDLTYNAPGVRGYSPFGQYGNRVQVLLDGHRINDDWLASSFLGFDLMSSLHEVEKIEVIRGPGSAVYGSGAFFGVINLVTPKTVEEFKVTAGMSMIGEGGIRGYAKLESPLGGDGGLRLYAGGVYRQPGTYEWVQKGPSPETNKSVFADNLGEEFGGSLLLKAWLGDVTLKAGLNDRTQQIATGAYETILGDTRTQVQDDRYFAELKYAPQFSPELTLSTRVFYDSYGYRGNFAYPEEDDGLVKEFYRGHVIGSEIRGDYAPLKWARFTLGGEYRFHFDNEAQGRSDSGLFLDEEHPYHSAAAFGIAHVDIFDWWSLQVGARLDAQYISGLVAVAEPWSGTVTAKQLEAVCAIAKPDGFEPPEQDVPFISLNPRIATRFIPWADGTLKLMFGRAFRAASIYELTYNDGCFTQSPSPGLTEESVYTGDIEYIHKLPSDFWLTLSSSLSVLSNAIHQRESSTPIEVDDEANTLLYYTHLEEPTHSLQTEVEIRKEFRRGWMLAAHYGYQVTKVSSDGRFLAGVDVPNAPIHLAGAKFVLPLFNRRVRLASRFYLEIGRKNRDLDELPPTVLWDLVFSGELPALQLRYSAGIRNILNWSYSHPVGDELEELAVKQPGTSATVDLHFQF